MNPKNRHENGTRVPPTKSPDTVPPIATLASDSHHVPSHRRAELNLPQRWPICHHGRHLPIRLQPPAPRSTRPCGRKGNKCECQGPPDAADPRLIHLPLHRVFRAITLITAWSSVPTPGVVHLSNGTASGQIQISQCQHPHPSFPVPHRLRERSSIVVLFRCRPQCNFSYF